MNTLPFKTQPKNDVVEVGTAQTGTIELPRFYGLTVAELLFIEQHTADLPDIRQEAAKLAIAAAPDLKVSPLVVFNALLGNNAAILGQTHLQEAVEFQQLVERVTPATKVAEITACIKHRLQPDWTIADTQRMDPRLQAQVSVFVYREVNGWEEQQTPPELTDDNLKK